MELNIYSLFDRKAKTYGNPFTAINTAVASRMVDDLAADPTSTVHKHNTDFELYQVATFNQETGQIKADIPEFIKIPDTGETNGNENGSTQTESVLQLQGS